MNIVRKNTIPTPERFSRYKYSLSTPMGKDGRRLTGCKEHIVLSRTCAAEGMVLLENDGTLPIKKDTPLALFGIGSIDYVKGGGGSGEVNCAYVKNLYEAFSEKSGYPIYKELSKFYYEYCKNELAINPANLFIDEPIVDDEIISGAAKFTDTAIFTMHRFSTEGMDRKSVKGDFYLNDNETIMLKKVAKLFKNIIIVLDIGGIIDLEFIKSIPEVKSILLAWQGGMEGCGAIADILCGDVTPSGKLTDTFAASFDDYPSAATFEEDPNSLSYYEDIYVGYRYFLTIPGAREKMVYPFGYGLSYTTFDINTLDVSCENDTVTARVEVKNTGSYSGKEVLQLYYKAPQGLLGKPALELADFKKTKLLSPDESEILTLSLNVNDMASFDDLGKCRKSAYILEKGLYEFFIGNSCTNLTKSSFTYEVTEEFRVTKQLTRLCAPNRLPRRMLSDGSFEDLPSTPVKKYDPHYEVPKCTMPLAFNVSDSDMFDDPGNWDNAAYFSLADVADGKLTLDEFMQQLSVDEMISILGGRENKGVSDTHTFGGIPEKGVPNFATADGPAGIRLHNVIGIATTAWPSATLIASTFNTELMYEIGAAGAKEAKENGLAIWLTPALNIHRNPLCGRNFEYFSEDPLVAGKFAAAETKGIQSQNTAACPKHFACNNREEHRRCSDSRVSERALREIYLKGFEICVKEADPWVIMTSYNGLNNVMTCENYELITGILRGEWNWNGVVTSDWCPMSHHHLLLKAGNDIRMPHGYPDKLKAAYDSGELTIGQIYVCAKRMLQLFLKFD